VFLNFGVFFFEWCRLSGHYRDALSKRDQGIRCTHGKCSHHTYRFSNQCFNQSCLKLRVGVLPVTLFLSLGSHCECGGLYRIWELKRVRVVAKSIGHIDGLNRNIYEIICRMRWLSGHGFSGQIVIIYLESNASDRQDFWTIHLVAGVRKVLV